jgi:hypothetical protein
MIVSFSSTLFISCIFFYREYKIYKDEIKKDISVLSSIIIKNCVASLSFDVSVDALTVLNSLSVNPNIMLASIYGTNNNLFASYKKKQQLPDMNLSFLLNSTKNNC